MTLPDPATRFNICQIRVIWYDVIFDPIVAQLQGALVDLGYACTITPNRLAAGAVNVVVGPYAYHWPNRSFAMPYLVDRKFVLYQAEQMHRGHVYFRAIEQNFDGLFTQAAAIWEFSPLGMAYFEASPWAHKVSYVPPGYHRVLDTFRPDPDPYTDVLFYGWPTQRRVELLDRIRARGVKLVTLKDRFGEELNTTIRGAKMALNVHSYEGNSLETVRVSHLLANQCFVISETSDHNPYGDGVVYADYGDLVDTICAHLDRPADRAAIAAKGHEAVRRIDTVANVRAAIERMPIAELTT
jgi:hypothetical protein